MDNVVIYNGHKFFMTAQGYYLGQVNKKPIRLHRYIWECEVGPIPKGHHIHHLDGDKSNNRISNLTILSSHDHASQHGKTHVEQSRESLLTHALPEAVKWHKSESGKLWHKEHYEKAMRQKWNEKVTKVCEICGKEYQVSVVVAYKSRFCHPNCKATALRRRRKENAKSSMC